MNSYFTKAMYKIKKWLVFFILQEKRWQEKLVFHLHVPKYLGAKKNFRRLKATQRGVLWVEHAFVWLCVRGLFFVSSAISGVTVLICVLILYQETFSMLLKSEEMAENIINRNQKFFTIKIANATFDLNHQGGVIALSDVVFDFKNNDRLTVPEAVVRIVPWYIFSPSKDVFELTFNDMDIQFTLDRQGEKGRNDTNEAAKNLRQYGQLASLLSVISVRWLPKVFINNASLSLNEEGFGYRDFKGNFVINTDKQKISWEGKITAPFLNEGGRVASLVIEGYAKQGSNRFLQNISFQNLRASALERLFFNQKELLILPSFLVDGSLRMESSEKERYEAIATIHESSPVQNSIANAMHLTLSGRSFQEIRQGHDFDVRLEVENLDIALFQPFYSRILQKHGLDSPTVKGRINGEARTHITHDATVGGVSFTGEVSNLFFEWEQMFERPALIDFLDIEVFHNTDDEKGKFKINKLSLEGKGGEGNGILDWEGAPDGWAFGLSGQVEHFASENLPVYWPKFLFPKARDWVMTNVVQFSKGGIVPKADIEGGFQVERDFSIKKKTVHIKGMIDAENISARYIKGAPLIHNIKGQIAYDTESLEVIMEQATSEGVDAQYGKVLISKTDPAKDIGPAKAKIAIDFTSSDTFEGQLNIMRLLPFSFIKELNDTFPFPVTGDAVSQLSLEFPLVKNLDLKQINVGGNVRLKNVEIVGQPFRKGKVEIEIDKKGVAVEGQIGFFEKPIMFSAHRRFSTFPDLPLKEVSVDGHIDIRKFVDAFVPYTLENIEGSAALQLHFRVMNNQDQSLDIAVDMQDTRFDILELGIRKERDSKGKINVVGKKIHDEGMNFDLFWSETTTKARIELDRHGALSRVVLPKVTWPGNHLEITYQGKNAPLLFITGGSADLSPLVKRITSGSTKFLTKLTKKPVDDFPANDFPIEANITFEQVKIWKDFTLPDIDLVFRRNSDTNELYLNLDYEEEEDASLAIDFSHGAQKIEFSISNFGSFLKKTRDYDQLENGTAHFFAFRDKSGGPYEGRIELERLTLHDAPVFTDVFSALGIFFGSVDLFRKGFFVRKGYTDWRYDKGVLWVDELNLWNSSQRIGMRGNINFEEKTADLRGQYVPLLPHTFIIENTPLLGPLLSGGKTDGFAGISYSIEGDLDDLKTTVQPLSIIVPGLFKLFIRNLREGKQKRKADET